MKLYKVSLEEFEHQLLLQNYTCPICLRIKPAALFACEHNHITGKWRGVVCRQCNSAMGGLKDDPAIVERALSYLRSDGYL